MPVSPDAGRRRRMRVALFAETGDGHARRLAKALERRHVKVVTLSLRRCGIDSGAPFGLRLPGFDEALPAGALVRSIPGGSFEQVTLRLGVLHALRDLSVPVWNDARAIERSVDKSMTSHIMVRAGVPTPPTFTAQSLAEARGLVTRQCRDGRSLVLKPLFGAQGQGLRLIRSADDLPAEEDMAGVYYLQHFVEPDGERWQDYRVFVCDGAAIAGMARIGAGWITNIRQGARPQAAMLTDEMKDLATGVVAAVGADYAGVDIIRDRSGQAQVLEVNTMPAWSGLQRVTPALDIAQAVADGFVAALMRRAAQRPVAGTG